MKRKIQTWNEKEESKLVKFYNDGLTLKEICMQLNRSKDSVAHRIALLKKSKELVRRKYKDNNREAYYNTNNREIEKFEKKKSKYAKLLNENYKLISDYDKENQVELTPSTRAGIISDLTYITNNINKRLKEISKRDIIDFLNQYQAKGNKTNTKKAD